MINFDFNYVSMMKKSLIVFILCSFFLCLVSFNSHPYHVGSMEFNYNSKSKTFEITGKFFMDDLENALNKKYGKSVHFLDSKSKSEITKQLENYSSEYIKLKSDNQFVKINFVGYEEDHESVNVYLESEPISAPKKVETAVSFLYNLFDDQENIIHIIVKDKRKSEKLIYPNRYLHQQF